jgi:hypothetical protein
MQWQGWRGSSQHINTMLHAMCCASNGSNAPVQVCCSTWFQTAAGKHFVSLGRTDYEQGETHYIGADVSAVAVAAAAAGATPLQCFMRT